MTNGNTAGKRVAPWGYTVLVLLPLAAGSAASAYQHTLEHVSLPGVSDRLSAYFAVLVEEWLAVFLVWLQARRGGPSIRELVSGGWPKAGAFLRDMGLAIGFLTVAVPLEALMTRWLGASDDGISFLPKSRLEAVVWVVLAATAGFAEELIFRGFLTWQFQAWTKSSALAIVLQGLLFGLAHGYYSRSMLTIAVYGCLLGWLAWWRKSLRPGMLAHLLEDEVFGLLAFTMTK
ncbi:MAG TPA: type II CAAX endopeptidase family protein [Verrucomicrobiae bacterium]|nr:type II CAAX endopeptidase family protein [Verrucomicrobiae bacterium]